MKQLLALFLVMLIVLPAFAGDHYGVAVSKKENHATLTYYGAFLMPTDSTDNWYTDAMWIGGCQFEDARIYVTCSNSAAGTEDVNVFPGYYNNISSSYADSLNDTDFTFESTFAGLDQVTQGAWKIDSLNVNAGAETMYKMTEWLCLKIDGQAGHPDNAYVYFRVVIPKPTYYQKYKSIGKTKQTY